MSLRPAVEGALFAARDAVQAAATAVAELRAEVRDHCARLIRIEEALRQLQAWRSEREGDEK